MNAGSSAQKNPFISQRYGFDEALAAIHSPDSQAKWNDSEVSLPEENASLNAGFPKKHIKHIRGTDLDENGDAGSWTFVVEHGDQLSIAVFNNQGLIVSNSPGSIQRAEIFTDKIMSPSELFEKNRVIIFDTTRSGTTVSRDLILSGGNYTISTTGQDTPRILVFDATTGVLTSSNDEQ